MGLKRIFGSTLVMAALAAAALVPATSSAHVGPAHMIYGFGTAGANSVVVNGANQALDSGTAFVGSTVVTLSCVEVIASGPTTHLAAMYGTGGGLRWTILVRQSAAGDFLVVNNVPTTSAPADANLCGIGNPGATGAGTFWII
ncbi:MAG TPA: hypothetical protein VM841_08000 [Actinomycetota bacterium]|nr:hypothetical protein [Actinomycetota bacterium]